MVLEERPHSRRWVVVTALAYRTRDQRRLIVVPAGFETDGASVPRPLWWLYPPLGGDYDRAAVVHDYLYREAERLEGDDHGHLSRAEADRIFWEAMGAEGFRWSGRVVIYSGVRAGGWAAWRRYREAASRPRAAGGGG
jgi:hypothetical protein